MLAQQTLGALIDRHVSTDVPEAVELHTDACLAVLTSCEVERDEHAHAHARLKQIGGWFGGDPVQVAALIDTLAALDPLRRARRKAVLTRAWADLLTV
ncbi:hypothetical protein SAMN02799625_05413 [Methylobacterium sp. UNC300MFChir4.1]|uniref:hypothetical protein n=1 Tax=Methylobacterium sp. UNC300MFChir4.1 TaxID=1502747 RepID=UPI0008B9CA49|nr:hypothetical protein [Methylobacterium sp. UNC300MFChir4.1]SEP30578.1 hypothetical protein SAMN02799625_05413 [Methylobacterium sp. UNC300MFChir4.1]